MAVDYREQYRPGELEPFWPNEIVKMIVAVLVTLAVIMLFAILPVLLDMAGVHGVVHHEEPADPHGPTPAGIKPEWYFLATYQYLRLMPTELLGVSGKVLGVLSQGLAVAVVVLLPFWYRRRADRRPGWWYRAAVTAALVGFLGLTIWGGWPEQFVDGHERLVPLGEYVRHHPMMFVLPAAALVAFYVLVWRELREIRHVLDVPRGGGDDGEGGEGER